MPYANNEDKIEYNRYYYDKRKKEQEIKKNQMVFGLKNEILAIPFLNAYFGDNLQKTENKFCSYDYTGLISKNIYELKSNTYSIKKYPNAVIDKKKIDRYEYVKNLIIIFSYEEEEEGTEFYFIKFDYDKFQKYNKRIIALKRGYENEIIDIPISELSKCLIS